MSREEMTLLVGTTRETLSGSLHRLADKGAVSPGSGTVRILDRSILEQLSE